MERSVCGLRAADGAIECWGPGSLAKDYDPPAGAFSEMAMGLNLACALAERGNVICWGDSQYYDDRPGGSFETLGGGGSHMCGVRPNGEIECWGTGAFVLGRVPEGSFAYVTGNLYWECGITREGRGHCWGLSSSEFGQLDAPQGRFAQVSVGTSYACGLRLDGRTECWGNLGGVPAHLEGPFSEVAVGTSAVCGVKSGGMIECEPTTPEFLLDGTYRSIDFHQGSHCAIDIDGNALCPTYGGDAPHGVFSKV
jgi:hypothetical protein